MAKRILVPVDGPEGEAIIPLVAAIARGSGATVRLVRVVPVPELRVAPNGRIIAYVNQEMERRQAEVQDALAPLATSLDGVPVETVARFGEPAMEIALEAEAFGADLIAMTPARRRALWRLVAPDLADQLARKTSVPVLVLREPWRTPEWKSS